MTAPLPSPRLRPEAVPTKFPDCPTYLSSDHATRESPDTKRIRLEAEAMQKALAESVETFRSEEEADRVLHLKDLADYVRCKRSAFWDVIERNEHLILLHIDEDGAPFIKFSVTVKGDFGITFHFMKRAMTKLGSSLLVPTVAASKRALTEFLDGVEEWNSSLDSPS